MAGGRCLVLWRSDGVAEWRHEMAHRGTNWQKEKEGPPELSEAQLSINLRIIGDFDELPVDQCG